MTIHATEEHAIVARDLVKGYGRHAGTVKALNGLSLEVETGTLLGLLGPNGAGKTTAMRIFATLQHPDAGRALAGGHDPVASPKPVRALIGLAGQNAAVDENLTGRENLRLAGRLAHLPRRTVDGRVTQLLEHFRLGVAADRTVKTYSGGMRRRLDLAAALVHRPPILFLDEPTTGLDPRSRGDVWTMIRELVDSGTTVLLTTQYLEEADALADQIVVMDTRRAIAAGTAGQLKAGLPSRLEFEFADEAESAKAAGLLTPLADSTPLLDGRHIELATTQGRTQLLQALRLLDRHGVPVTGAALREPTLDDVFLNLPAAAPPTCPSTNPHSKSPQPPHHPENASDRHRTDRHGRHAQHHRMGDQ